MSLNQENEGLSISHDNKFLELRYLNLENARNNSTQPTRAHALKK